ncbi:deoxyribonuclease V [Paludifilum halophilum]|uniref:Endonuclease V n=1 Tax=Paludifilum halophilum TaxID=1642702 RepID=A0A235B9T7_9BACL|nr:deoxyribonuclease V [Paludifilum halophilum]OYD09068.1 endonuclease V [Paludifilum halophilum]
MEPVITHPWDIREADAWKLQQHLASKVIRHDPGNHEIQYIAGVDVAYDNHSDQPLAAAVVLDADSFGVVETAVSEGIPSFPYIPGLFSFRELPPIIQALKKLTLSPDLIVCDGHGVAHPRRLGLASHLGVLFEVPTIGCGKTRLVGEAVEPGIHRGDSSPLVDQREVIGHVLRTQDHTKPVFVSIGHRISLPTACDWILKLSPRYRLPETTRQADQLVRKASAARFR